MSKQYLYRHFDKRKNLLYVGISVNPTQRLSQHKKREWFDRIENITIKSYPNRRAVLVAEEKAIKKEKPVFNKIHNKKRKTLSYFIFKILTKIEIILYIILLLYLIYITL